MLFGSLVGLERILASAQKGPHGILQKPLGDLETRPTLREGRHNLGRTLYRCRVHLQPRTKLKVRNQEIKPPQKGA